MIDLINRIAEADILLDIINGELKLFSSKSDVDPHLLAEIKDQKSEIMSYLSGSGILDSRKGQYQQIPLCAPDKSYPISDGQRRLWVLSQFEEHAAAYHMIFSKSIHIKDTRSFSNAIDAALDRHEILRTVFKTDEEGEVRQFILSREELGFEIGYQDYSLVEDSKNTIRNFIAADAYQPFDLENGPLIRASLLQVSADEYVFYYNMHHIIGDGWSMEVLVKDVMAYYIAFEQGKKAALPQLGIQYKDYAAWQLNQLNQRIFDGHKKFWTDQFTGDIPVLDLPSGLKRAKLKTNNGKSISTILPETLSNQLRKFCQQNGGTIFMGLLASLNALFYRYTGQDEFIIGCPVAGRDHVELENQIGFYINTLALKNQVKPDHTFKDLFLTVKQHTLQAYQHQQYPFDRLIEDLQLDRDISRNALFDVMLVLQHTPDSATASYLREPADELSYKDTAASKVDLEFLFEEDGQNISLNLVYNSDVYEQHNMATLIQHLKQLMTALLSNPDNCIDQIDYLNEAEKDKLLNQFNETETDYPFTLTVLNLFCKQVKNDPNKIAVAFGNKRMSYQELDEQSNQLAHCLKQDHDILPEDLVGIKLDRSEWVVVSILAVLKLGAAYVPVDPDYSSDRETYILNDSQLKLLITEKKYANNSDGKLLLINGAFEASGYSKTEIEYNVSSKNLAYMIYTSGSTGTPKGVMIEHHSLMNYLNWCEVFYLENELQNGDFGLYTTLSFDLTVTSFFLPLVTGNTLWVFGQEDVPDLLKSYLSGNISCIKLTPAHISLLKELEIENSTIELAIVGGDHLLQSHIDILRNLNPKIRIYNEYGPTETTVGCMIYEVPFKEEEVLIGYPIFNTEIYVLNASHVLQPLGITGELCIGGDGLARAYLNRPDLNAEKFVPHPFKEGERIYKTGDLARWLPDGNMVFLGRKDDQVKIRGYRIELGEIESQMKQCADVDDVLVLADENESGEKELTAFFISSKGENTEKLRSFAAKKLPNYMVPSYLVQLDKFPLTVNGKIDKKALLVRKHDETTTDKVYQSPVNELEVSLMEIWEQVLNRNKISTTDDFFALGGHSLKAIRLITAIHKLFGVKLNVKQVFLNATIREQAALIGTSIKVSFQEILPAAIAPNYPLSYEQRRLWVLCQLEGSSEAFNMPSSFLVDESTDFDIFEKAISSVIERHEVLRTVFKEDEHGEVRQWILEPKDFKLSINHLDFRSATDTEIQEYISRNSQLPFDLEKGPLLRVNFLQVKGGKCILHYNMHHIISDGISMQLLSKDILAWYTAHQAGSSADLDPLKFHYKDYAVWQRNELKNEKIGNQTYFWKTMFKDGIPRVQFPFQKERPKTYTYLGNSISFNLGDEFKSGLAELTITQKGSMYITFLFLVKTMIYQYTGADKVMAGSSFSTRTHHDLEKQLGFYINNLPLVTSIESDNTLANLYQQVRETVFNVSEKSWYPLELLVDQIEYKYDAAYSGLFNVLVEYHENTDSASQGEKDYSKDKQLKKYRYNIPCQFDLSLEFFEKQHDVVCVLTYNNSLIDEIHMELFKERLLDLIQQLSREPQLLNQIRLKDLQLDHNAEASLSDEEKEIASIEEDF